MTMRIPTVLACLALVAVLGIPGAFRAQATLGAVQRSFTELCRADARLGSVDRLILSLLLSGSAPHKNEKDVQPPGRTS
jgi:hypothetical protein